jgi:hypothetical protein
MGAKKCPGNRLQVHNPLDCRDSELEDELNFVTKGFSLETPEPSTAIASRKGIVAFVSAFGTVLGGAILTFMFSSVSSRVSETKICAPLPAIGPAFDVGDCHSVAPGSTCEVHCAIGYANHGVRASAQFSCPPNNRDSDAVPAGSPHTCKEINECRSNPCQHESECHDQVDAYSCACTVGYEGDNCAAGIDTVVEAQTCGTKGGGRRTAVNDPTRTCTDCGTEPAVCGLDATCVSLQPDHHL